jgi:hypothetical protein
MIVRLINQPSDCESDSPIESDATTSLALTFRQDLGGLDEREIFREAILEIFGAYSSGDLALQPEQFDILSYLASVSSLPRRRQTEFRQLLESCLRRSEANDTGAITQSLLNLMADEFLVTNVNDWTGYFSRFGPSVGFQCFYGIGLLDLPTALDWLDQNFDQVDYDLIRDFGYPSLVKRWVTIDGTLALGAWMDASEHPVVLEDFRACIEQVTGIKDGDHRTVGHAHGVELVDLSKFETVAGATVGADGPAWVLDAGNGVRLVLGIKVVDRSHWMAAHAASARKWRIGASWAGQAFDSAGNAGGEGGRIRFLEYEPPAPAPRT